MKVVLFCGGLGLRLRDYADHIPKPMVAIGYRPILWHVMKYFAHFGHRDFILCLGYRGDLIKQYFLNYSECTSNDFVFSNGGKTLSRIGGSRLPTQAFDRILASVCSPRKSTWKSTWATIRDSWPAIPTA